MPPAKKRTRSYDPTKIRTAVLAQFAAVRTAVAGLTPEQLAAPTRLGDWTVRELAAHLTMVLGSVARYLDAPEPDKHEVPLQDWPFRTSSASTQVDVGSTTVTPARIQSSRMRRFPRCLPAMSWSAFTPVASPRPSWTAAWWPRRPSPARQKPSPAGGRWPAGRWS